VTILPFKLPSLPKLANWLIAFGIICIAIPLGLEIYNYPWATINNAQANEIRLPNAPLPSFPYINYSDLQEALLTESRLTRTPSRAAILPGLAGQTSAVLEEEEVEEETEEEEPWVDPYIAYLEYANANFILLGNVKIPRLALSENLFEGTDGQLIVGVGHVPGTAMPGEEGNCAISAHRVHALYSGKQPFRYLDSLQEDDLVQLVFQGYEYTYAVYTSMIVTKYDTWVLLPIKDESHILTLITCDPVIGSADRLNRLIVFARLVKIEPLELPE